MNHHFSVSCHLCFCNLIFSVCLNLSFPSLSTFYICSMIIQELPPTPSKFHYIFNLRDLSRIYNGLCRTTPERFSTVEQFLRVWRNESIRVIGDRLINEQDKTLINVRKRSLKQSSHFLFLLLFFSF